MKRSEEAVFHGGGRMGERMRAMDWSRTPLGAPRDWPAALRTIVGIMLAAKQPMFTAWGPDLTLLYNDGYRVLLGGKDRTALGRPFLDVWTEVRADLVPLVDQVFAGEPVHMDLISLMVDRGTGLSEAHFAFSYTPVREEAGTVVGFFCPCSETTELVNAERRQAFRLALEDSLRGVEDAHAIVDTAVTALGRYLGASRVGYAEVQPDEATVLLRSSYVSGVQELSGAYQLDVFGKQVVDRQRAGELVAIGDVLGEPMLDPAIWASIETRAFVSVPLVRAGRLKATLFVNQDKPRTWSVDETKLIQGVAQRVSDAVERVQAETALRESETHLRGIFQQNGAGFAELDETGRFLSINDRFCAMAGRDRDTLLQLAMADITHPDSGSESAAALRHVVLTSQSVTIEKQLVRPDGSSIWVANTKSAIASTRGRTTVLTVSIDITARKQVERALADAKFAAEEANLAKSTFIANMSHELRTPLSAIIGYSEMMAEEIADGCQAADLATDMGKVEGNARHLLGLINDVLDLSKVESGKMEVYAEDFAVEPLLRDLAGTVDSLIGKKGNRLTLQLGPALGTIRSDVTKVRQVLLNLLSNAAKFTEQGTITLAASRGVEDGVDGVTFAVSDTGIGMTEEQLSRLFQRFQQADASTTRRFGGTGLGLSLAKAFSDMLGSDVSVQSRPGEGSTFTWRLPATFVDASGPVAAAEGDAAHLADEGATALRELVLVIDDDRDQRALMTRFLHREGFQARTASDGRSGLVLARQLRPRAILLDVMMPGIDGWSVLSALKADPDLAPIPVVMVTFIDQRGLASALGAADYVVKPVKWDRFKAVMDRFRETGQGVLIVDDDADMRRRMRSLLEREGWSVREAENGQVGLDAALAVRPEVIVLDLSMPVMDGFTFFEQLRSFKDFADIPVIVLSALDLSRDERRRLAGASQILNKGDTSLRALVERLKGLFEQTTVLASDRDAEPIGP